MSQDLGRLLVKALNGLPVEEQGALLVHLLGRANPGPWAESLGGLLGHSDGPDPALLASVFGAAQDVRASRRANPGAAAEPELKVLPVRLPVADYERLRDWSRSHDFSMAVIVRTLVERFLDGQEKGQENQA